MVERFNGRIEDVLRGHLVPDAGALDSLLAQYLHVYLRGLPRKALGHLTPAQALHAWRAAQPECFKSDDSCLPGPDSVLIPRESSTS